MYLFIHRRKNCGKVISHLQSVLKAIVQLSRIWICFISCSDLIEHVPLYNSRPYKQRVIDWQWCKDEWLKNSSVAHFGSSNKGSSRSACCRRPAEEEAEASSYIMNMQHVLWVIFLQHDCIVSVSLLDNCKKCKQLIDAMSDDSSFFKEWTSGSHSTHFLVKNWNLNRQTMEDILPWRRDTEVICKICELGKIIYLVV